jgi:hypothetical protein
MVINKDRNSHDLNIKNVIGPDLLFAHGQAVRPLRPEESPPAFAN